MLPVQSYIAAYLLKKREPITLPLDIYRNDLQTMQSIRSITHYIRIAVYNLLALTVQ